MQPFTRHTGIAAPLIKDDINTDQIAPILHSRGLKEDYKAMLFHRARQREDGSENPDFVLNKPQFRAAGILVTGHNFGAGSSRESAVWSMLANDIRVIVAQELCRHLSRELPAERLVAGRARCRTTPTRFIARVVAADGAAPFTVDLVTQRISGPGGPDIAFRNPRPPIARGSSKASTISGSRSSTWTRSRAGRSARRRRSRGCKHAADSRR